MAPDITVFQAALIIVRIKVTKHGLSRITVESSCIGGAEVENLENAFIRIIGILFAATKTAESGTLEVPEHALFLNGIKVSDAIIA